MAGDVPVWPDNMALMTVKGGCLHENKIDETRRIFVFEKKLVKKLIFDEGEIETLIQENYKCIYRYCFYHVRNREVAQDITQDVFLKFIKEIDRYKEYGRLKNYLYVIAKNSIRDYIRKTQNVNLKLVEEEYDDGGIDKKLMQMSIWEALDSLDDLDKEIIILRYYQELRIKDISQIIDIPASTVRYKLKNAEKALKNRLEL